MTDIEDSEIYRLLTWIHDNFPFTLTKWIRDHQWFRRHDDE